MKSVLKVLLASSICAVGLTAMAALNKSEKKQTPIPMVTVSQVKMIKNDVSKRYVGNIKAIDNVDIIARVSGQIMRQLIPHGSSLKAGQVVLELEDTIYKANVDSARAKVRQYEQEVRTAKKNFERAKALLPNKAVSESAYDEAARLYEVNESLLASAKAALVIAEDDLSHTKVRTPITGRMGRVMFSPGNYVHANSTLLFNVVSYDPIYVDFPISVADFLSRFGSIESLSKTGNVQIVLADGSAYCKTDASGKKVPYIGKFYFLDNKVDTTTDTIIIRMIFENPDWELLPGGLCTIYLRKNDDKLYPAVPLTAILTDPNGNFVYVLDQKNIPSRRAVELGNVGGKLQIIESGLKGGEIIVVDGTHKVRPGNPVNPVQMAGK